MTGDRFTEYKQDLLKTMGVSRKTDVEDIMSTLATTRTEGLQAVWSPGPTSPRWARRLRATSEEFKNVVGAGVSGIQTHIRRDIRAEG